MNPTRCEEASELVECIDAGRLFQLTPAAAEAWRRMQTAAATEGIELRIVSAYRSIDRQRDIVDRKRADGLSDEQIFRVNARPGYSEHHTGRAVDLTTTGYPELEERFADSPAFAWLCQSAGQFGFRLSYPRDNPHGIIFEPWHWCWHPGPSPVT